MSFESERKNSPRRDDVFPSLISVRHFYNESVYYVNENQQEKNVDDWLLFANRYWQGYSTKEHVKWHLCLQDIQSQWIRVTFIWYKKKKNNVIFEC